MDTSPTELVGCEVWRTAFDYQVRLTLVARAPDEGCSVDAELVIETPFLLRDPDLEWHDVNPGAVGTLSPVLRLFLATVTTVEMSDTGALSIEFSDGHRLVVTPDRSFESWSLSGTRVPRIAMGPRD